MSRRIDDTSPRIDAGALLSRSFPLALGRRVRLRMVHRSDRGAIEALLDRRGVEAPELAIQRLLNADPRECAVICALTWVGGAETLVGVAASDLAKGSEVDTLVVDEELSAELGPLLAMALADRRRARRARHAA